MRLMKRRNTEMKVSRIIALASVLTVLCAGAVFAKTTMSHGKHVNGSVTAVDQSKQTFDVKAKSGKSTDLTWNAATKAPKEPLAAGEMVNVTYMVKDGRNVATVITLETPKAAKPAKKS
jgi:flagellar basal body-associated protein FliL